MPNTCKCNIAVLTKDKKILSIYCHQCGEVMGTGKILYTYYNSEKKARDLINLGSVYEVRNRVETESGEPVDEETNVTISYYRDLRDNSIVISKYKDYTEYVQMLKDGRLFDYAYIFDTFSNQWLGARRKGDRYDFASLGVLVFSSVMSGQ